MSEGAAVVVAKLATEKKIHGIISLGGGGGTAIGTAAMRALPVGFPKLMVSTLAASENVPTYVGVKDVVMMPSVVDVAGLNRISRPIFANAAGAICGMVEAKAPPVDGKPIIGVYVRPAPCWRWGAKRACSAWRRRRLRLGQRPPSSAAGGEPTWQAEAPCLCRSEKSGAASTQALRNGGGRVTACETELGSSRWHESMHVIVSGEARQREAARHSPRRARSTHSRSRSRTLPSPLCEVSRTSAGRPRMASSRVRTSLNPCSTRARHVSSRDLVLIC